MNSRNSYAQFRLQAEENYRDPFVISDFRSHSAQLSCLSGLTKQQSMLGQ
jgi:hypothetical protein